MQVAPFKHLFGLQLVERLGDGGDPESLKKKKGMIGLPKVLFRIKDLLNVFSSAMKIHQYC